MGFALILTLFLAMGITADVAAEVDIQSVLQALQQQAQQDEHHNKVRNRYRYRGDDDENNSRFGSLRPHEVEKLIQQALDDNDRENYNEPYAYKNKRPYYNDDNQASGAQNVYALWEAVKQNSDSKSNEEVEYKNKKNSLQRYQQSYKDMIDRVVLLDPSDNRPRSQKKRKRLLPSTLYPSIVNRDVPRDLNDYSKVYVILNVDAIQKSKTQNNLKDLVSTMLEAAAPGQRERGKGRKERRYKGFRVKTDYRKAGRDADEVFVPKDADDADYKPKRPRSHDGGGGRTPIPYIRHRGDIYEKDN